MTHQILKAFNHAARKSQLGIFPTQKRRDFDPFDLIVVFSSFLPARLSIAVLKRLSIDIRLLWDNHRHYWVSDAIAYSASIESTTKIKDKLCMWYKRYPIGRGYPYGCAMESAFRIINMSLMFGLPYNTEAHNELKTFIRKESQFVINNLEVNSNNNHYLLNIVGLIIAGSIIGELNNKLKPLKEFEKLLSTQFLPDGGNFEASTGYHFLTMEALALSCLANKEAADIIFKKGPWIKKGVLLMESVLSTEGNILSIGDDDSSSCFWPIRTKNLRRFQFELCKYTFGEKDQDPTDVIFPTFGLIRKKIGYTKLFFYGTRNGQNGKGGHAHNDKLSIGLWFDNKAFIVDSGSYSYAKNRNKFRSIIAHSTINLIGIEPCDLKEGVFYLPDSSRCQIKRDKSCTFSGTFQYGENKNINISRNLEISQNNLHGIDRVIGKVKEKICSQFILSPEAKTIYIKRGKLIVVFYNRSIFFRSSATIRIKPHEISMIYGDKVQTSKVIIYWPAKCNQLEWEILWK